MEEGEAMIDPQAQTRLESDPYLGRTVDGFRIEELVGRGGMGAVYKATQLSLGRDVALKLLPPAADEDAQYLERFWREADVLSKLSHPNVVSVIDRGEVDGHPYLAMEYVEGTSLRDVIKAGPLPPAEALATVRAVLAALEHAHERGIIHRDIKPENVLVAKGGVVKVADFGLGRLLGPVDTTRLTHTHLMLGTYEYMSPEQREKAKEADERSDLYATGVVLYEMIAGELPIGAFEPLSQKRPGECDRRIDEVVQRSLEKAPERRYQRASEMGEAVSRLLTAAPEPMTAMSPEAAAPAPAAADDDDGEPSKGLLFAAALVAVVGVFLMIEGVLLAGLLVLVVAVGLTAPWLKRFAFNEVPVARILRPLPRQFAERVVEDPEVQLWIRKRVPGLWRDFPAGLDFDEDEGRLVVEIERGISPHVRRRFCSALGRVLEANADGALRRIATADEEWERTSSAEGIPLLADAAAGLAGGPKASPSPAAAPVAQPGNWVTLAFFVMLGLYLASVNGWRDEGWAWLGACVVAGAALFRRGGHLLRYLFWTAACLAVVAVGWYALLGTDQPPPQAVAGTGPRDPVQVGTLPSGALREGEPWATKLMMEWLETVTAYDGGATGTARRNDETVQLVLALSPERYTEAQRKRIRDAAARAVSAWYGTPNPTPSTVAPPAVRAYPPPTPREGSRLVAATARGRIHPRRVYKALTDDAAVRWLAALGGELFPEHLAWGQVPGELRVWSRNKERVALGDRHAALVGLLLEKTFPTACRHSAVAWQRARAGLEPELAEHPVPELTPAARIDLAVLPKDVDNLHDLRPWIAKVMTDTTKIGPHSVQVLQLPVGRVEVTGTAEGTRATLVVEAGRLLAHEQRRLAAAWGEAIGAAFPRKARILAPSPDAWLRSYLKHDPPPRIGTGERE